MVNIRKLQQTGGKHGSSFLVILPKKWVVRQDLGKGDPVVVAEREDGCLIIDPRLPKAGEPRSTRTKMQENLRWAITSKYLLGFDEIRIASEKKITNKQRDQVKGIIKGFVALEVTDETENEIVVQCLVDPSTLPVRKAMRRMNLIASRMLNDALDSYFTGNRDLASDVVERDDEVNRLFFLIVRELRSAIQYPRMSEVMGVRPVEALDLRLAAHQLERIADLIAEIAARTNEPLGAALEERIKQIADRVREMLSKSFANLFKFDPEKVAWVIQSEKELIDESAKLRQHLVATPNNEPQTHLYVVDNLQRIGEAAKDIVDLGLPQSQEIE